MHGHMKCSLGWNQYFMWAYILLLEQSQQYGWVQNLFYRLQSGCHVLSGSIFGSWIRWKQDWGYINWSQQTACVQPAIQSLSDCPRHQLRWGSMASHPGAMWCYTVGCLGRAHTAVGPSRRRAVPPFPCHGCWSHWHSDWRLCSERGTRGMQLSANHELF